MSTFLQMLRLSFWMYPLQRLLTLAGAAIIVVALLSSPAFNQRFNLPGTTLPLVFVGLAPALILLVLTGGVLLRMLPASRALLLLPHFRSRLLASSAVIALLATLLWIAGYWIAFQHLAPRYRPDLEGYLMMYVLTLSFATQCVIGIFIASRGPLQALIVMGLFQLPGLVLRLAGAEDVPRLLAGPVGFAAAPLTWVVFGLWFLRVRNVMPVGWKAGPISDAAGTGGLSQRVTREQAMERWVLGGATSARVALQWTCAVALLVTIQLLIGRESPPGPMAAMLFGTLSLSAVIVGGTAHVIAARSRGLWLNGGRLREELHSWCERLTLRVAAATLLPFVAAALLLWAYLPARPALPLPYLLAALVLPAIAAAWTGLLQVGNRPWIRAPCAIVILLGWFYGLVQPLYFNMATPRWGLIVLQLVTLVILRQLTLWSWRGADWRRARPPDPVS